MDYAMFDLVLDNIKHVLFRYGNVILIFLISVIPLSIIIALVHNYVLIVKEVWFIEELVRNKNNDNM